MNSQFCHLHTHNEYSLLDGYGSAKDYVTKAKELGFTALGLTNHANIDGLIKFQQECDKQGIIPVLGCEAYIVPDLTDKNKEEKRGHVCLWIKNQEGFENLCQMLTIANLEGFYYKPRIDYNLLLKHCEGLVVGTACYASFVNHPEGTELLLKLQSRIGDDLYLEIMPHDFPQQYDHNDNCAYLSDEYNIKMIATNDCHYVSKEDEEVQDTLLMVQTKATVKDQKRFKFEAKGLYLRTYQEMVSHLKMFDFITIQEIKEILHNTMEIVEKCGDFRIKKQDIYLPTVPGFETMSVKKQGDFLWDVCFSKLDEISRDWDKEKYAIYTERLDEEFALIEKKGFIPYFMVVYELINWCKKEGIMIGPGRGSVGGCLMAYLLGIHSLDPIHYNLIFSRFINEDRIDYPDIDIDFQDNMRDRVREHLEDLYGENKIASISTFLTMKGRMAIRDVARVYQIPNSIVDKFAKSIEEDGEDTIIHATKGPEGQLFYQRYKKQVDIAAKLEGQVRGTGQHAAGIIISADDLTKGTRGVLCLNKSDQVVCNWDMPDCEWTGLMKLDVLALRNLTILAEAKRLIHQDISFDTIPLNDKKVYAEISKGNNFGVFQLNTWSTSKVAKEIKCKNIFELSDIIALVRPGPRDSGMTDQYLQRKKGAKWAKKHPLYDDIVKDTFGVVVYQEQIMEIFYKVAGLSYVVADKIRKIMGKKRDAKDFEPYRIMFIKGCLDNRTLTRQQAETFWVALQSYARYVFNKAHSMAYAILAYTTAWVKYHYPTEFICANLTYGAEKKKEEIVKEAYRLGLSLVLPKRGVSDAKIWIAQKKNLYIPFIEIKGIGDKTAEEAASGKKKVSSQPQMVRRGFLPEYAKPKKKLGKIDTILLNISRLEELGDEDQLSEYFNFKIELGE